MPRWPRQKCGAEGEESRTRPSRRRRRSAPTARTGGSHAQRYTRVYTRAPRRSLGRPSRSVGFLPGLPPRRSTGGQASSGGLSPHGESLTHGPFWMDTVKRGNWRAERLRVASAATDTLVQESRGTDLLSPVGGVGWPQAWASQPRLSTTRAKLEVVLRHGFSSRCRPRVLRLVARDRRAYSKSHEQPHGQDPQVAPARQEVLTSPGRAKTRGRRFRGVDWLDWPCGQNPVGSPKAANAVRRTRR